MQTQKQVHVHGPDDVRVDDVPVVVPGERDVLIRVAVCGICGSDVGYAKLGGVVGPSERPMPLGHELSGTVEAIGSAVTSVSLGDRVVLDPLGAGNQIGNGGPQGGFTPRLLVRNAADALCLRT